MLKILADDKEIEAATGWLARNGYHQNIHCRPKNWDLSNVIPKLGPGNLLDMGCLNSFVIENALKLGIPGEKVGIDLAEVELPAGAKYIKGDLTKTGLPDGHFDTITCLSTIEHGIDLDNFLTEAYRLLAPGGRLLITFDYHNPKLDSSHVQMYGAGWNIFDRREIEELLKTAWHMGFHSTGSLNYQEKEHPVPYGNLHYTFGLIELQKNTGYDVLIVNSERPHCGVHQFGLNLSRSLQRAESHSPYKFRRIECASSEDLKRAISGRWPAACIFNYAPSMMPWVNRPLLAELRIPTVGIYHEITESIADSLGPEPDPFDMWICGDPTLKPRPRIHPGGRPIPLYKKNLPPLPKIPTIGMFGFGSYFKGHIRLLKMVAREFERAILRLHVPYGYPDPRFSDVPQNMINGLRNEAPKHVTIEATHDFMETPELLDWLAANTLNAFLYEDTGGRGISSAIDYALAVPRPIAITRCNMFRHIMSDDICVEKRTLREIIEAGTAPLEAFKQQNTPHKLISDYGDVLRKIL